MSRIKSMALATVMAMFSIMANAQTAIGTKPQQVDIMRSNGKIYVVMAVILIIMIGFFSYLISVDRKISKMEKL